MSGTGERLRSGRVTGLLLVLVALVPAACSRAGGPAPVAWRMTPRAAVAGGPPATVHAQPGETAYDIARRYRVPLRSLILANDLPPPFRLAAGQRLILPRVRQYVARPGDTLADIARRFGVDASSLAAANGIGPPYGVESGQALVLPGAIETAARLPVGEPAPHALRSPAASSTAGRSPGSQPVVAEAAAGPPPTASALRRPAPAAVPGAVPPASLQPSSAVPLPVAPRVAATSVPAPRTEPEARVAALVPPPAAAAPAAGVFAWPVQGSVLTAFGPGPNGTQNDGINIAAPLGTPVRAAAPGTVAYAGNELRGYGNLVLVKHPGGWITAYAHCQTLLVRRGDSVARGQIIARVGATGAVGAPQLHFELRRGTRAVDPAGYLPAAAAAASG